MGEERLREGRKNGDGERERERERKREMYEGMSCVYIYMYS